MDFALVAPVPWAPRDVMWGLGVFLLWILFFAIVGLLGEELKLPIDAGLLVVFGEAVLLLPVWYFTVHKYGVPWQLDREGSIDTDVWELFNLEEDFSQSTDLALRYPEKLEELKALFEKEAEKYDVYPLDGNLGPRLTAMQARAAPKDKELVYYPPAAIRVHESVSPPLKNRSHEFIAEVDLPASGGDGMLVTAGGRTAGYGLFIKNGRLMYVYNYIGIERTVLTSTQEVPRGKSELRMRFTRTGDFEGDAELFIDDRSVGKIHIAKTIPITFSIEETFDVGEDTGSPIIEDFYAVHFRC